MDNERDLNMITDILAGIILFTMLSVSMLIF